MTPIPSPQGGHTDPILSARPVVGPAEIGSLPPFPAGQVVVARVVSADAQGALLSLAGQMVQVEADITPRLVAGQTLSLQVTSASPRSVTLRRLDTGAVGGGPDSVSQNALVRRDLAAALADLGVTVDENNLLAAQSLVRFGVAITDENLADVRRGLLSGNVSRAEAVALAKSLHLPLAPAILRALDTLLSGPSLSSPMTLALPPRPDREALAAQVGQAVRVATRSLENKLLRGDLEAARSDLRAHLLRAALGGDGEAEAAARHLEGQMLVSAASQRSDDAGVFVAVSVLSGNRSFPVEMRLRPDEPEEDDESGKADPEAVGATEATLRLPTTHLGVVTARLRLSTDGRIVCRLSTPDAGGLRQIEQSMGRLTAALTAAGFARPATYTDPGAADEIATPGAVAARPLRALDLRV